MTGKLTCCARLCHRFDAPHFCLAVMDKLMDRGALTGKGPVDPFCGKDYPGSEVEL